jgi:biotin transport system ATP-binding protein
MKTIIEINNLTHRFADGFIGIDRVSLSIKEGEFVVIAGPNGSGKTTLFHHLNGLLIPDSGTVIVNGVSVKKNPRLAKQLVGMVFQDADSQIVGETVYDDAAFGPENLCLEKAEVKKRVMEALATVGLNGFEEKRPHLLSQGEKRRLAIAGILSMKPKVLVLDEPFSNLDYFGVKQVLSKIIELHRSGHTILVSTHDMEKVAAYADRLIIMNNGKKVKDAPLVALLDDLEKFGIRQPCSLRLGKDVEPWLA